MAPRWQARSFAVVVQPLWSFQSILNILFKNSLTSTDFFDESSTHRHHESMLNRHLYAAIGVKYEFRLVHPEQPLNFYPTNVECTFLGCLRGDDPLMWRISHLDELSTDLDEGAE